MNSQQLNVEVEPLFRRSLKFRPAPVGARSDLIQQSDGGRRKGRGLSRTQQTLSKRISSNVSGFYYKEERLRGLETVSVDSEFPDLRFECLSGNAQLGSGAGWTPDHALGFPQCGFDHFSFTPDKVSDQRNTRRS